MKVYWKTATPGSFATASDWSTSTVPGPSDIAAMLASGGPYTVAASSSETVLGINTTSNATLAISGSGTVFNAFAGTAGGANRGTVEILNGSTLEVIDGSFDNIGTISLESTGTFTQFEGPEVVLLYGGGQVSLSDNSNNDFAIATNVDNTISGAGTVFLTTNEKSGVIDANGAAGLLIQVGPVIKNYGVFEATGAGGLFLGAAVDDFGGGLIKAQNASTVYLGNVITGGTLQSEGSGIFQVDGPGQLDGTGTHPVTIDSTIVVLDGSQLAVQGIINNTQKIQLNGGADTTALAFGLASSTVGNTTLEGGGSIELDSGQLSLNTNATKATVTNVNNTITGVGSIFGLTFINETGGVIDADSTLSGSLGISGTLTNAGVMEATGNAILRIGGTLTGTSTGKIETGLNATVSFDDATVVGGTVTGTDQVTGFNPESISTFDGSTSTVNLEGTLNTVLFGVMALKGAIDNTGTIQIQNNSSIEVEAGKSTQVTLKGTGSVTLDATGGYSITTANPALPALTLLNYNHILGTGIIGGPNLLLNNEAAGIIEANGVNPIVIDTGSHTLTNSGKLQADTNSALLIESNLSNSGTLEADGGFISVSGAATGAGSATIVGTGQIEFAGASSNSMKFTGSTGQMLILDDSVKYTGTVLGFSGSDKIDLADIASPGVSDSYSSGTLTVKDMAGHIAHIKFSGSYTLASFNLSDDGNGGTMITDPPVENRPPPVSNIALFGNYLASCLASASGGHGGTPNVLHRGAFAPAHIFAASLIAGEL